MTSKKITRTRWRCDHCRKGFWQRPRAEKHERGCTLNPDRVCSMHRYATGEKASPTMPDLIGALDAAKPDCGLAELRELADGCPCCILAAIRQSKIESLGLHENFNFRAEMETMWESVGRERLDRYEY